MFFKGKTERDSIKSESEIGPFGGRERIQGLDHAEGLPHFVGSNLGIAAAQLRRKGGGCFRTVGQKLLDDQSVAALFRCGAANTPIGFHTVQARTRGFGKMVLPLQQAFSLLYLDKSSTPQ